MTRRGFEPLRTDAHEKPAIAGKLSLESHALDHSAILPASRVQESSIINTLLTNIPFAFLYTYLYTHLGILVQKPRLIEVLYVGERLVEKEISPLKATDCIVIIERRNLVERS